MANYFIGFDLSESKNEELRRPMSSVIQETFAPYCFQYLSNGWFIATEWPPEDIRTWLLSEISPSWHGIVIRITSPMFGLPSNVSDLPEWLLIGNENS